MNRQRWHLDYDGEFRREERTEMWNHVDDMIKKIKHDEHMEVYGPDNDKRLTGKHETCDINTFKWGVSDRGASIRVPWQVQKEGKGYIEDRRPAANIDPYEVCFKLVDTICN